MSEVDDKVAVRAELVVGATVGAAMLAIVGFPVVTALMAGAGDGDAEALEAGKLMVEREMNRRARDRERRQFSTTMGRE